MPLLGERSALDLAPRGARGLGYDAHRCLCQTSRHLARFSRINARREKCSPPPIWHNRSDDACPRLQLLYARWPSVGLDYLDVNALASSAAPVSSGIMSDASHDDLKRRPHAGKSRGAGERWRKSFSGYPLTTSCGNRILYLEAPNCRWWFESLKPQSRRRPLSPTPAPPRRPHRNLALCKFRSAITGWT